MCKAERDVYLSQLLCLGYIGAFILLCIILLTRKRRDDSHRQRHGPGLHLHLVHSLVNNSMFQMEMEHRRSMSRLMDRLSSLEEHLKSEGDYRRRRHEKQSPRRRREHCETTSRRSQVSREDISQNYFSLAADHAHGLSQDNKELQSVINSLRRQNEELTERLEGMSKAIPLLEEHVAIKDLEIQDLQDRCHDMEMSSHESMEAAEELDDRLFKALEANEQIAEANDQLQQQLSALRQDKRKVVTVVEEFEDAMGEMKALVPRDVQLSNPPSIIPLMMMEELIIKAQVFSTIVNKTHYNC